MLGTTLHHRFRLEQVLHRAPSGVLYLATDERSGEMLAVKLFPPHTDFSSEDGLRYRRAMQRLAAIAHPHLLVPRHTGMAEGVSFQVLPYFPGDDLNAVLADGPLPPEQVTGLLRQVAEALQALHRAGLAHLNLKPSNLLLSRAGDDLQVVVCDPLRPLLAGGLGGGPAAHPASDAADAEAAAWLAPEQVPWLGGSPDGRSDLYALGALAYRALAGAPPFAGATALEVLHQHGVARPPGLREHVPEAPPRLAAIVAKLLAKQPRERYQSAAGLLADLAPGNDPTSESMAESTPERLGAADRHDPLAPGAPIVGREAAREALLSALARAAGGQGSALHLSGPPGSGRAALLGALLPHLEAARALVLRAALPGPGECAPFEAPIALLTALAERWESLPRTQRRDLLHRLHGAVGEHGEILTELAPALDALLPQAGEIAPLPLGREHLRTQHVLCEAFAALGEARHPLVLWLDEAQYADPDSLEWLTQLARRVRGAPVLLIVALQPLAGAQRAPWEALAARAGAGALQMIELAPLGTRAIAQWLSAALGCGAEEREQAELPQRLAAWMEQRWGGLPLALEIGLHLLVRKGVLRPAVGGARWQCDWAALERDPWPESLPALIQHRLELLPDELVPVLQAAAASAEGGTFAQLGALLEHLPPALLLERIEAAIAEGLLRREGARLCFAHALVRQAAWQSQPPPRQEALQQQLGAALEAGASLPPLLLHHRAAGHFRQGGDALRALEHGCRLVAEAGRCQALRGVAAWVARLEPALAGDARQAELLLAGGIANAQLGRSQASLDQLAAARALPQGEDAHLDALAYGAWAEHLRGRPAAAIPLLEEALQRVGETLPAHAVGTALARLGGAAARRYEALLQAASGATPAPLTARELRICELLALASRLLADAHPERALLADERLVRLAGAREPSPHLVAALLRLGETMGDPGGAPFRQAGALLERYGFPHAAAAAQLALGRCRLAAGDWRAAEDSLRAAWAGFRALGALPDEVDTLAPLLELARLQGALPRLRNWLDALAERAHLLADPNAQALAAGWEAWLGAVRAELPVPKALEALRASAAHLCAAGQAGAGRHLLALAVELALLEGDLGAFLALLKDEGEATPAPLAYGGGLLQAALAEGRLVQAALLPSETDHLLGSARSLLQGLRGGGGSADGPLRADQARVEVMERFLVTDDAAALGLAEEALERLEEHFLTLAAGLLRLRTAEGLKSAGDGAWLRWGGAALTAFDAVGAALPLRAARRLLEIEALPAEGEGGSGGPAAQRTATGAWVGLLERIAAGGAMEDAALQEAALAQLLAAADAEYGGWFAPDAQGRLMCTAALSASDAPCGPLNRWLAESVWKSGQPDVLARYRPTDAGGETGAALPAAQSLLCLPIEADTGRHGVVMVGSAASRAIFDAAQAAALAPLGREAAALLALNTRLRTAQQAQRQDAVRVAEAGRRQHWAVRAAEAERLEEMLEVYLAEWAAPLGYSGALLCFRSGDGLQLGASQGALADPRALAPLFPLPLQAGQAEAALSRQRPISATALDAPAASVEEQALLQALGGGFALWLPLLRRGSAIGAVLLLREDGRLIAPDVLEQALLEPLRSIAPALYGAWQARAGLAERTAARQEATDLALQAQVWRRWLPAGLPANPEDLAAVLHEGIERSAPVLYGATAALTLPAPARGEAALPRLRHYFERVQHGLALHESTLAHIEHGGWAATYPASVDGALWGAQTLHQLLLELRDEAAAVGSPMPPTGLGLHLGEVLWGAVPAGEGLRPLLAGPALRIAARLARMSITFRCGLLVSEATVEALGDRERFDLRPLGRLRPAPGEGRLPVYELFSLRDAGVLAPMRSLQGVWAEGLREYQRGRWSRAAGAFHRYAQELPQDRPARFFLRRCRQRAPGG